ncbi:MAG: ATP phosphoribosyltransferase [Pseudomonadota bacterium]
MSALTIAIPSKGRLKEQMEAFLWDSGLKLVQDGGDRGYAARLQGLDDIEVRLLSAGEIANAVLNGEVHIGVTGEDLLRERAGDLEQRVKLLRPLGFGYARLVVAAPKSWIDVETMADLDDVGAAHQARTGRRMRVATKYLRLAREFFAAKGVGHYRIVESAGATEGAPATGAAELIVDITTTGRTLDANGLKIIGDGLILESEAQLAASLTANWSQDALSALRGLLDVLEARKSALGLKSLRFNEAAAANAIAGIVETFELQSVAEGEALCKRDVAALAARALAAAGAGPVRVSDLDFAYEAENAVFEALLLHLGDT